MNAKNHLLSGFSMFCAITAVIQLVSSAPS
uniref:Uncharacterized protein n=1 Tax=Anguilla anguilla TaxID=7936 RepID=A0A0E9SDJ2_ANGAN